MSEQSSERDGADEGPLSVGDDQLPEDLRPSEDNPLAEPAGDDVPDDILKDTSSGADAGSEGAAKGEGDASPEPEESGEPEESPD
jgi:hypothetical protein